MSTPRHRADPHRTDPPVRLQPDTPPAKMGRRESARATLRPGGEAVTATGSIPWPGRAWERPPIPPERQCATRYQKERAWFDILLQAAWRRHRSERARILWASFGGGLVLP